MDPFDVGRSVEEMTEKGRQIVREAIETYKPAAVVAAFSGGNDSVVSTHFACDEFNAMAVHCDTGIGIQKTRQHVENTAIRFNWGLVVRRANPEGPKGTRVSDLPNGAWVDGDTAYEEFVLNNGFPGPAQHPRIYQRIKERQLRQLARELAPGRGDTLLIISGIRHDESSIRAGYKRAVQKQSKTKLVWANPFYWQTGQDFEAYRQEFALPRNPVKAHIGISGECLCGAFAAQGEKELVYKVEPETAAYIDGLETKTKTLGFPWGWGEGPPSWWLDQRRGQGMLFPMAEDDAFSPMCVGCPMKAGKRLVAGQEKAA